MKPRSLGRLAAMTLCAGLLASAAQAQTLRYAIGHPPGSYLVQGGELFAETVAEETDGDLSVEVYPMSLLSMAETSGGLREGIADVGAVMSTYFSSEFPHANLLLEASMMLQTLDEDVSGRAGVVFGAAMADFIFNDCPECNAEFAAQNQVYAGGAGTPEYALNCTRPLVALEDMQGKRLRIGGANWGRWSEAVGASPVNMSGNEMLEALSQGVIDCIILSTPDIYNFGMGEAVKHITLGAPGGVYVASLANLNRDSWQGLSEDQRRAVMRGAAMAAGKVAALYRDGEAKVLEDARAAGVEIHEADPALVEKTREFVRADLDAMAQTYADRYGVERGAEILGRFRETLEKWAGLTSDDMSAEEIGQLYWDEIYAKVDVSTHGN